MANKKIRVGVVGANPNRGFASVAHIPALLALPDFELIAVCTSRQESADATAQHYGVPLAFADAEQLAQHPDVDLVTVCVKGPDHYLPVMAAIAADKAVLCEWPLGRDTEEALEMFGAAARQGVRHTIGLQGRMAPPINYVRDLLGEGFLGRVLSVTMAVSVSGGPIAAENLFQTDWANGSNSLTIAGGHTLDLLRFGVGDFRELVGFVVQQYPEVGIAGTDQTVAKSTPDQLVVSGIIGDDIAASYHLRGGGTSREPRFSFEIHGEEGDLTLTANAGSTENMQRQELILRSTRGSAAPEPLEVPTRYRWVPDEVPIGTPYNVAQLYTKFGEAIRDDAPFDLGFDVAIGTHRVLDTVVEASATKRAQTPVITASL